MNEKFNTQGYVKQISWSAVFVGALIGVGLSVLLNLFSIAIGLSAFTVNKEGITVLAIGGFLGVLIGSIVAMYLTGFIASYLGRLGDVRDQAEKIGIVHGFTAWCASLILMAVFAAQIGQYIAGYTRFIAHPATIAMNAGSSEYIDITVEKDKQLNSSSPRSSLQQTENAANKVGHGTFAVFILFFAGAIASCFGGYYGVRCRLKKDRKR